MRLLPCIFLLLAALALRAQDVGEKRRLTLEELKKFYADEKDRITTAWIDMEGPKDVWASLTKAGYLPVFAEGKWEQGTQLHRIGYKSLQDAYPGAEGVAWYCYYGMEQDSFDRKKADFLKKGYTLVQKMSFTDRTGKIYYCAAWVKPAPMSQ